MQKPSGPSKHSAHLASPACLRESHPHEVFRPRGREGGAQRTWPNTRPAVTMATPIVSSWWVKRDAMKMYRPADSSGLSSRSSRHSRVLTYGTGGGADQQQASIKKVTGWQLASGKGQNGRAFATRNHVPQSCTASEAPHISPILTVQALMQQLTPQSRDRPLIPSPFCSVPLGKV